MLSFKDYKKHILNESFGGPLALGVSTPTNMGVIGGVGGTELEESLKEKLMALKGKAKAKFGGKPPVEDDEDETGDGEVVDAASEKDEPDVDVDDAEIDGGCCGKKSGKKSSKKSSKKMSKMKKCDADMDDEDMGDEEDIDPDAEEGEVSAEDDEDMGDDEEEMDTPMFSKKSGKKSSKKSGKKMKAEQTEDEKWMASVKGMLDMPTMKFGDGWTEYHEDSLIPPSDPNAAVKANEPAPGQPGFAPQGRIGDPLGNASQFEEWKKLIS